MSRYFWGVLLGVNASNLVHGLASDQHPLAIGSAAFGVAICVYWSERLRP